MRLPLWTCDHHMYIQLTHDGIHKNDGESRKDSCTLSISR